MELIHWPLVGLRLRTRDLVLRPTVEADLSAVVATLSADVGMNPHLPRFPGLDASCSRAVSAHQSYWQSVGNWSVGAWRLDLVIVADDRIVGVQSLEGEDFLALRTVDSASHLIKGVRGRGWGKQSRQAVLALAFGPLGAEYAVTSAWESNGASLGVSRALGYRPNGESRHRSESGQGAATMVHLRMSRAEWEATGSASSVTISGFERCRPFFGLWRPGHRENSDSDIHLADPQSAGIGVYPRAAAAVRASRPAVLVLRRGVGCLAGWRGSGLTHRDTARCE